MNKFSILNTIIKYRIIIILGLFAIAAYFGLPIVFADGDGGYPLPISGGS